MESSFLVVLLDIVYSNEFLSASKNYSVVFYPIPVFFMLDLIREYSGGDMRQSHSSLLHGGRRTGTLDLET